MAQNSMKVVVYVRAEDAKYLEHVTQGETKAWVRNVVRQAIKMRRERDERERSD